MARNESQPRTRRIHVAHPFHPIITDVSWEPKQTFRAGTERGFQRTSRPVNSASATEIRTETETWTGIQRERG